MRLDYIRLFSDLACLLFLALLLFTEISDLTQKHPYLKPKTSLFKAI